MDSIEKRLARALRLEKEFDDPSVEFMIECVEAIMRQVSPHANSEMMGEQRVKSECDRLRSEIAELKAVGRVA